MDKKTKGFKINTDFGIKLEELIKESGLGNEAFLEYLVALHEMQKLKEGSALGYQNQIEELEYHSKRNVELFISMLETEAATRMQLSQDHEDSISQRAETIMAQEREIARLEKDLSQSSEKIMQINKENESLNKQIEQQQEISKKDNLLVEEYKSKLDTLTGLVNQYKSAADENQELRSELNQYKLSHKELTREIEELKIKLDERNEAFKSYIADTEARVKSDQERLIERKDVEKERELLNLRTEYQEKLEQSQTESTVKIRELYELIEKLRQQQERGLGELKRKGDDEKNE